MDKYYLKQSVLGMPIKTGIADLPLHSGHVPGWLIGRMRKLADAIVKALVDCYGEKEFLVRISDPLWFQSFGCVLGFDWHSSGLTTVVVGVLREALSFEKHGVAIFGGKGVKSRMVPEELRSRLKSIDFDERKIEALVRASRLSAKVDNSLVQDGYDIYHHAIIVDLDSNWAVVQQGINEVEGYARRYHWLSDNVKSFVVEPHASIVGDRKSSIVLNMVSKYSEEARKTSVDLVCEHPSRLQRLVNLVIQKQDSLTRWVEAEQDIEIQIQKLPDYLRLPKKISWEAIRVAYEYRPRSYEELIEIKGIGPSTIRALALISTLLFGSKVDWKDPIKFSFAVGGKDGVPFPVRRDVMDRVIEFMRSIVESSDIEREERLDALRRLAEMEHRYFSRLI